MGQILPHKAINKMLKKFGNGEGLPNCYIYFSRLCSCVGETGNYDPTCKECIEGYIYEDEPTEELVIRTAMNLRMMNEKQVHMFTGGCNITIPALTIKGEPVEAHSRITHKDIIVMKDDLRRDRDLNVYGEKDYLSAFDVKKIWSVSEKKKVFELGKDYDIIFNRIKTEIKWIVGGKKPEKYYTVEFSSEINYLVWDDQLKPRGAIDSNLPKKVACRLRTYFDANVNTVMDVNTSYPAVNQGEG